MAAIRIVAERPVRSLIDEAFDAFQSRLEALAVDTGIGVELTDSATRRDGAAVLNDIRVKSYESLLNDRRLATDRTDPRVARVTNVVAQWPLRPFVKELLNTHTVDGRLVALPIDAFMDIEGLQAHSAHFASCASEIAAVPSDIRVKRFESLVKDITWFWLHCTAGAGRRVGGLRGCCCWHGWWWRLRRQLRRRHDRSGRTGRREVGQRCSE